jgi:hypothetical protein
MLDTIDAALLPPMDPPAPPAEAAPGQQPPVRPAPTWWVNAKGTPMTRHVAHKTKPTKTACGFSLSRMREADPDERMRLGVCSFCAPAGKALAKKVRRR